MTIDIKTIQRIFEGNFSRQDYLLIAEKLSSKAGEKELEALMKPHWDKLQNEALPNTEIEQLLHKLHKNILQDNYKAAGHRKVFYFLQKIAAILFIPLLLSFFALGYLQTTKTKTSALEETRIEIQCPMGVRTKFTLPDGTTGFLNSGSSLVYSIPFVEDREVLLNGEAYFDVVRLNDTPFKVITKRLHVKVLGTSFNIISYPGEQVEEVVIQSGLVAISDSSGVAFGTLEVNQRLVYNINSQSARKSSVIASQYTSWTQGKLVFRNEDMQQVAARLSRWYNADIIISDSRLEQFTFYATFVDEPLDEVLKLLAITTPIAYSEELREASVEGQYSKRKIFISINPNKINQFK